MSLEPTNTAKGEISTQKVIVNLLCFYCIPKYKYSGKLTRIKY